MEKLIHMIWSKKVQLIIRGVFNGYKHPEVVSGHITIEQAFDQFVKNFNITNGKITKVEWDDYYAAVSFSLENDDHFVLLLKSVWQL